MYYIIVVKLFQQVRYSHDKTILLQVFFSFIHYIAKLMSFSEIRNALHPPPNEQTLLKCVQQHAVLVQGSWVVKRSAIELYRLTPN